MPYALAGQGVVKKKKKKCVNVLYDCVFTCAESTYVCRERKCSVEAGVYSVVHEHVRTCVFIIVYTHACL